MKVIVTDDYAALRRKDYPSLQELADALYHQAQGDTVPMETYLTKCGQVKQRYPKPVDTLKK